MAKLIAIAIIAFAIQSPTALAADPALYAPKGGDKGVTTVADALEKLKERQANQPSPEVRRKVSERYGGCLARISGLHGKAVTFLLSGKESDGWLLADPDCFGKGLEAGNLATGLQGSFPPAVMRSLVANGLVRADFHKKGPTDFSAVPPLAAAPRYDESDPMSEFEKARSIADQLGECAARVSPEGVRRLAQTKVESDEETTAIRELVPTFAQCLPPGVKLAFEPGALRDASVLAYARLAFTLAASGAGEKGSH